SARTAASSCANPLAPWLFEQWPHLRAGRNRRQGRPRVGPLLLSAISFGSGPFLSGTGRGSQWARLLALGDRSGSEPDQWLAGLRRSVPFGQRTMGAAMERSLRSPPDGRRSGQRPSRGAADPTLLQRTGL